MPRIRVRDGKGTGRYRWMLVDAIDAPLFAGGVSLTGKGYAQASAGLVHRIVAKRAGLPITGRQVDHLNGRRLDNRRKNLEAVTNGENRRRGRKGAGKSRLRGVKITRGGRFEARLTYDGVQTYLGTFKTAIAAHRAYRAALAEKG